MLDLGQNEGISVEPASAMLLAALRLQALIGRAEDRFAQRQAV